MPTFMTNDHRFHHARRIVTTLRDAGYLAYFAGGCVRDMILKTPPSDYDIATNAPCEQIQHIFNNTVEVGALFGVILVIIEGEPFQVSTFRNNTSIPQEDALLRDFTINGLFYDPDVDQIYDWVNGKSDIERNVLRAIGDPAARFHDDYLRLIRGVRIAAQLNFSIEQNTFNTICRLAPRLLLTSSERIRDELIRICASPHADRGMRLLADTSLLNVIVQPIIDVHSLEDYVSISERITLLCSMLNNIASPDEHVGLCCLFYAFFRVSWHHFEFMPGEQQDIFNFLKHYKFTNRTFRTIRNILENFLRFDNYQSLSRGMQVKYLQSETLICELEFYRLFCIVTDKPLESYYHYRNLYQSLSECEIFPEPLLTGNDLIQMGFTPSPHFTAILATLELKQLNRELHTKDEATTWVIEQFP